MKLRKIILSLSACIGMINIALASSQCDNVHVWDTVFSKNGTWTVTIQPLNEKSSFVKPDCSPISSFMIDSSTSQQYGFSFPSGDDFDVAYTLTLVQQNTTQFSSKACVFIVTAKSPANPDIRTENFNDATCTWESVPGIGEHFYAS